MQAVLDFSFSMACRGATVTRGMLDLARIITCRPPVSSTWRVHLPVKIEFIENCAEVEELLPKLQAMVGAGLIEMHDTTIVKPAEKKQKDSAPEFPAPEE